MLYIFKSPAAADMIMLQPNGERVLEIIGKGRAPKGILLPEHMPAAIAALEDAIARESAAMRGGADSGDGDDAAPRGGEGVSLRQRATPFVDMLKRCHKAGKEIVWGV